MDKFDSSIQEAASQVEPSSDFVANVMQKTGEQPARTGFRWVLPAGLAVAALAVVALVASGSLPKHGVQAPLSASLPTVPQTALTQGSDDQSLSADLASIQSSLDQSAQQLQASQNALNDQQPTISQ